MQDYFCHYYWHNCANNIMKCIQHWKSDISFRIQEISHEMFAKLSYEIWIKIQAWYFNIQLIVLLEINGIDVTITSLNFLVHTLQVICWSHELFKPAWLSTSILVAWLLRTYLLTTAVQRYDSFFSVQSTVL